MWTATVDFTKAFDSITHKSVWKALKACDDYISLLKKIYRDQKASVQTDEESNIFEIRKGTMQGDPLSSPLFNTFLQYSLKDDIQRWQKKKGMGIYLSNNDHDCLTNLRFADDVLLLSSSKEHLRKMLYEFSATRASSTRTQKKELKIEDMKIEILTRSESVKYLVQKISIHHQETTEIKNRIRAAWATFRKYRKNDMLNHRLRLFDAAISPTFCYAAGTWTPNKEHERMIQSTQRKMLRLIIQTRRRYKKIEKQESKTNDEIEETDTNDLCSTDDESGDGLSTTTHNDVGSEVSF